MVLGTGAKVPSGLTILRVAILATFDFEFIAMWQHYRYRSLRCPLHLSYFPVLGKMRLLYHTSIMLLTKKIALIE